jgi:dihydrofolate synthase/folylpolyglutamate synthase
MRVNKSPAIIFDSAHNPAGIKVLFDQLQNEKYKDLHIVLAVVNDKDLEKVLPLFPKEAKYYFSQAKIPRALDKEKLMSSARQFGLHGNEYSSVNRAFSAARRSADKKDLILVAGSIFTVAEVV